MYNIVYASYNIQCSAVYFAIAMAPFTHISRFRFFHKMLINTSQFGKTKISENHKIIRKKYNKTSAKFPEITDNKPHNCAYLPCFVIVCLLFLLAFFFGGGALGGCFRYVRSVLFQEWCSVCIW